MFLKTSKFPAKFLSAPGLALEAALKMTKVKLEKDQSKMVEKGIKSGLC